MITIPIWLFILIIILAAPLAIIFTLIILILVTSPLWGLVSAARADRYVEREVIK